MMKTCSRCGVSQPLSEFTERKERPIGYFARCKSCGRKYGRDNGHKGTLRKYKLTPETYAELLKSQKFTCALCLKPETEILSGKVRRLAVDHNHTTGKVRGLLCTQCNKYIGVFDNRDTEWFKRAKLYLEATI